jgi:hypothetical protein
VVCKEERGTGEEVSGVRKEGRRSEEEADSTSSRGFVWARDIKVDRIRLCKMGAEKSDLPGWGLEYPPIAEKIFVG